MSTVIPATINHAWCGPAAGWPDQLAHHDRSVELEIATDHDVCVRIVVRHKDHPEASRTDCERIALERATVLFAPLRAACRAVGMRLPAAGIPLPAPR